MRGKIIANQKKRVLPKQHPFLMNQSFCYRTSRSMDLVCSMDPVCSKLLQLDEHASGPANMDAWERHMDRSKLAQVLGSKQELVQVLGSKQEPVLVLGNRLVQVVDSKQAREHSMQLRHVGLSSSQTDQRQR